ncbi:MAG: MFS transporter [Thiotrichales bacterium]|nr:MAG: MFS transporter [Thiotrichales bacterium]
MQRTDSLKTKLTLLAVCLGFFMIIMDVTITNVALPSIAKQLGGDISMLQWVVNAYTLTFAGLLLSAGYLSDVYGAKKAFLYGIIAFTLSSIGCGFAPHTAVLIFFRLLQGASAAVILPTTLSLIHSSYSDAQQRSKAIGIWAGIAGIGATSGPIIGGILTSFFGWQAVFFVNVPIGIIVILLTLKYVDCHEMKRKQQGFDIQGQLSGIISMASLAYALVEAGQRGWFSTWVVVSFILFLVFLCVFLWTEWRSDAPMFPIEFFKIPTFSIAVLNGMIINLGFYGILFLLPLYFQSIRGYSVFLTGLAIIPQPAFAALASYVSGRLVANVGTKLPIILGLFIAMLGEFLMLITQHNAPSYWLLILPLSAIGFGCALAMPAATIATIRTMPKGHTGIASSMFNTSRQIGGLIGVAVFGSLVNRENNFVHGMHLSLIIAGSAALFGCVITALFMKNK